jgi:uncharacterized LabA/DUF88 family protein
LGSKSISENLLKEFQGRGRLIRASYYTALVESDEYSPIRPLVDWLAYNGFTRREEGRPRIHRPRRPQAPPGQYGRRTGRRYARSRHDHADHIVLFSGNGDFRRLVEAVKAKGVRVSVVSTNTSSPPMVADDLRREADAFIELEDIAEMIARPRRDQPDAPALDEDD